MTIQKVSTRKKNKNIAKIEGKMNPKSKNTYMNEKKKTQIKKNRNQ